MDFDATIAGENTTSYISLEDAEEILGGFAAWDALSDEEKQSYLMVATLQIDTLRFHGQKYTEDQALKFPRYRDVKPDGTVFIPLNVNFAVCEQVKTILDGNAQKALERSAQGVTARRIGDISESYGNNMAASMEIALSAQARGYLKGFISRIGKITL